MAKEDCTPNLSPTDLERWALSHYRCIKKRAKNKGLELSVTKDALVRMVRDSDGKCDLTGIPFSDRNPGGHFRRPWMPSLDRIDSSVGYTEENCRVVCSCVNHALGEWGEDVLRKIAIHIASQARWRSGKGGQDGLPKNVSWMPNRRCYRVRVRCNGINHHIGCFPTVETAEAAAMRARAELGLGVY